MGLIEWIVLAVISEHPTYGGAVAELTTSNGKLGRVWRMSRAEIYRALHRLAEAGLISAQGNEPGQGGAERTIYAATGSGHEAVRSWLDTPVGHVRDIRSALLLKLALLHRRGADASGLIRRQREALEPIARAIGGDGPHDGFEAVLLAWRRAHSVAAITFLDDIL
jgi:PadR family transcriptional regulator AphA